METARIVPSSVLRFSGTGDGSRSLKLPFRQRGNSRLCFSARDNTGILSCGFSDSGHMKYYQSPITSSGKKMKEIKTEKKRTKLIKRLTKDLDFFTQSAQGEEIGSRLMDEAKGRMISEATEVLLAELEHLRTEQKEQKRKRKEEKAKLVKSKGMIESESSSSSSCSSSESSDCDGGREVVDIGSLRMNSRLQFTENEAEQVRPVETSAEAQNEQREILVPTTSSFNLQEPGCGRNDSGLKGCTGDEISSIDPAAVSNTKIEICMGGKCKKLGAPMLLEEFEKKIGTEGSVVGCKCMGKCKSGPNVRVSNSISEIQEESIKCSVQTPTNPLYIGVGLEDVGAIVANLLSQNRVDDDCLLAAS